ncbi:MAG: pro-sigmaK processing inhibitor BofA family protein [Bacilli bacterium]|nr:pro-sigmaK processing inhibitor BofA family protein [Bacilli bacterium]
MKNIFKLVKKVIFSSFLLYGYNLLAVSFGTMIPINLVTVFLLVILGYPSLFSLILIQALIY